MLDFWFGKDFDRHTTYPPAGSYPKWFGGAYGIDGKITLKFKEHMEKYFAGEYKGWEDDKDGSLAAIIMCDQFTRNVYRKKAKAFENDFRAHKIVHEILEDRQRYDEYKFFEKFFIVVTLEHKEDANSTQRCIELLRELNDQAIEQTGGRVDFEGSVGMALDHHETVLAFGRYPHRNEVLGRKSTP